MKTICAVGAERGCLPSFTINIAILENTDTIKEGDMFLVGSSPTRWENWTSISKSSEMIGKCAGEFAGEAFARQVLI
jgi:hypothetical protein